MTRIGVRRRANQASGLLTAACCVGSCSGLNVAARGFGTQTSAPLLSWLQPAPPASCSSAAPAALASLTRRAPPAEQTDATWRWGDALQASLLALLVGSVVTAGASSPVFAEDELAALAGSKSTSELVDPQCFADKCSVQTKACVDNPDCTKGLVCTAKCMGNAECTVGCFARYGNRALDDVLQCTIEDASCIKIALMQPGSDSPLDAPLPPKPIIPVSRASMQGKWYKVMGWNPKYDCFDCQCNTFDRPSGREVAATIGADSMNVEVEYSMPRVRTGAAPERFSQTLHETLEFDTAPGSHRTAHTQGKMFGLTFWENWYVLGENKATEPQFKFVYYTGKTLQNRYEGAFVYARKPELPRDAMPHIYRLAREAGMDPTRFCSIDNGCFNAPAGDAQRPLFTPVAEAAEAGMMTAAATPSIEAPRGLQKLWVDAAEYLEDPVPSARALFGKQKQMYQIKEYDARGFRVPSSGSSMFVAPVSAAQPALNEVQSLRQ